MNLPVFRSSCRAVVSLRIGIVIVLTILIAVALYRTPMINRFLLHQNIWTALLAFSLFCCYILCILVGSVVGVVLAIVSFARGENRPALAIAGLVLNGGVLLLFAVKFFFGG